MKNFYEDFANKAASVIGLERTDIETFERSKQALFENNLNGAEALKNYLSYRYFDPKTENFLLTGSSAGFLLEISPLVGVSDSVVKNLNQFFAKELPAGGFLQFFLLASSDIEDFLGFWGEGRVNPDLILKRMTRERQEYLRRQAGNFHSSGKRLPRSFKLFVSYSTIYRNCNEASLADLQRFRGVLMTKLGSLGLQPRIGNTETLIRICREIFEFEPGNKTNYKTTAKMDLINNQCLSSGNYYQSKKKGFVNTKTGIVHRAFSVTGMPSFWSLLQNINLLGDAEKSPLPARFFISYTISNDHKTKKSFITRGKRIIDAAERPYSRHDKALHAEASEWREIIRRLTTEDNILSDSWLLVASAKEEDIDNVCAEIITQYNGQDFYLSSLDYFHLEAMLGSMPMHSANFWPELRLKKLVQPVLSSEVVTKIPIHAEWYGVPLSGVPLIGKRGQLFNWNPYYRIGAGNFNINVVGPSGVGKSVFLQDLASVMLAANTRVFILDIGAS